MRGIKENKWTVSKLSIKYHQKMHCLINIDTVHIGPRIGITHSITANQIKWHKKLFPHETPTMMRTQMISFAPEKVSSSSSLDMGEL